MTHWTPRESAAPSPHNAQMDAYVASGCPVDHGWRGWVGLVYVVLVGLVVLGLCVGGWYLYLYSIDAYPVVILTPVREWTNTP